MDVRDHILTVATRQFARSGFDATSLQAIAAEVGIRKQSLLYHFPSKDELRSAVYQKMLDHWAEALPRLLLAATSGEGQFDALVTELVAFFTADPDRARLVMRELLDRPDEAAALIKLRVRPWIDKVCGYIEKGQKHGLIQPDVDPEGYVVHVINLVVGGVAMHACLGGLFPGGTRGKVHQRHVDELVRMARASLFRPEAPVRKRQAR